MEKKTESNTDHICFICGITLTDYNITKDDDNIHIRRDICGKAWCISCTNKHDKIDWEEYYHEDCT